MTATATTPKRATGGKSSARTAQSPPKAQGKLTPGETATLQEYADHCAARKGDASIPVDTNLLEQVRAIKPGYRMDAAEKAATAQAKMGGTPQAPKADKGKGRKRKVGEPDARLAYPKPGPDGGARKGCRVAFHATDNDPEGTLKFLGLFDVPTHTEAIDKARRKHKLDDSALIVTLNARHAARSAPRSEAPTSAGARESAAA